MQDCSMYTALYLTEYRRYLDLLHVERINAFGKCVIRKRSIGAAISRLDPLYVQSVLISAVTEVQNSKQLT